MEKLKQSEFVNKKLPENLKLDKTFQTSSKIALSLTAASQKINLNLLKCEKEENQNNRFQILAESRRVIQPNRISHYIMVADAKKLRNSI